MNNWKQTWYGLKNHSSFMKHLFLLLALAATTLSPSATGQQLTGRFAPPAGKVLIFAGQDNASVGGTAKYRNGYIENVGVPAGITHYVYFSEGWTNKFNRTFGKGVAGLNTETEWASGPMHQKAYLDSPSLDRCVMHLSISMEGNCEDKVADGTFDHLIDELVTFVRDHPEHPFLIRIGYEFDGNWNGYDPDNFKKAFRRIVDGLRKDKLPNVATCYASSSMATLKQFEEYDPGAQYYDWVGYSWWGGDKDGEAALEFARRLQKPVFIAEATPRGLFFDKDEPEEVWDTWFTKFFQHIDDNLDVVRAASYINADWDSQEMWDGWGQSRLETAPLLRKRWLAKMAEDQFLNASDKPFELINFPSPFALPTKQILPYRNPSLPVEERVGDLLARMNLQEKVAQITGWWDPNEEKLREEGKIFTPEFYAANSPHGVGELGPLHNLTIAEDVKQYRAVQDYFRRQTRLGIPAILHDEAAHGFMRFEANSFPAPIGLSCTWNPRLLVKLYSQAGREARSRGISHILSPIVDVARDLRWGRVDETLGEDPFLVSRLGAAMVEGLQGSRDGTIAKGHVAATLKHFAGYAGTDGGRNRSPYSNGPRHLLDVDVAPFRHVIDRVKPAAVMAAFNEIDGLPCHVNPWILNEVLRGQLGFDGLTVGDYQGIDLVRKYQNIGSSDADAARMALNAGLQLELPNRFGYQHLPRLLREGKVQMEQIDEAVRAVLSLKFRLGLFEAPFELDAENANALARSEEATELAREAARQSIVLLRNEDNLLPLDRTAYKTIAVIGPNAATCRLGSYSGRPLKTVSLLEGIRDLVGEKIKVTHAEGCKIALNDTGDSYANWRYVNEIEFATLSDNKDLIDEAIKVASEADLVILAIGENVLMGREAWGGNHVGDRSNLDLTESQQALSRAILDTGKPVVAFLNNGSPITLHDLGEQFPAILTGHYAGQETGTAAAEILFGETSPSGKLTVSWPRSVGHLPIHYSQHGSSQVFDYVDSPRGPVYPFGYGLNYTTFEYSNLTLSAEEIYPEDLILVGFDLTNTGKRIGTEIAQLYVSGQGFPLARPGLELKGFQRITLMPGETKRVSIEIYAEDLVFHDSALQRSFPAGTYQVRVGGSSTTLSKPLSLKTIPRATTAKITAHPSGAHSGSGSKSLKPARNTAAKEPAASINSESHPTAPSEDVPAGKRPNVLFIAIDDLRPELGTYGAKVKTPNLDKFARSGTRFDRAYVQQAVCGASRLSIMTGLYPTLTGEQTFHVSGWRKRHPDVLTMNQHFGRQGYTTVGLGKIYHGTGGSGVDEANWTRWINLNVPEYADETNIKILKEALARNEVGTKNDPPKGPTTESADVPDDTYADGQRANRACKLLENFSEATATPFFLAVGLTKPHLPFVAPQKYWDLYDREDFKMPANKGIPPGYPLDAANPKAYELHKYSDILGKEPKDYPMEVNQRLLHGYAACVSYADACVGKILTTLEETGLDKNTIVVLWGDHGWKLGDHGSWSKHTNFECDTRAPLIIRAPGYEGGTPCPRLVEFIDLYPTLCDLTGLPVPAHCQGRSFRTLLEDPTAGHRYNAYSSYPSWKALGHSIRFKTFRYTEWHAEESDEVVASVLTDLSKDPGEVTNVVKDPAFAETLAEAQSQLSERLKTARAPAPPRKSGGRKKASSSIPPVRGNTTALVIDPELARQKIDGFGGSIAFWGTRADDKALTAALKELNTSIVRAQGEVTKKGVVDHNRDVLQRAMKINPDLQVLLSFWQPRSSKNQTLDYWLQTVEINGGPQYTLRPERRAEWANEMVARVQQYLDWGINVTAIGVQNESNWSHEGTQTCRWEPGELASFIETLVKPRLRRAGLGQLRIAAPDLAFIGSEASELKSFLPAIASPAVDIAAYHMYDSYIDGETGPIDYLVKATRSIAPLKREHFPDKSLWMTETTGAQWNGEQWHTYGWTPELTEHQKAIKAARYLHMTLADAGANAFLWWGLVYSLAPETVTDRNTRQKHRDEGLVLVSEKRGENGTQAFVERTKKFYTFQQYSRFVEPGFRRLAAPTKDGLQISAYRSPDRSKVVVVAINDTASSHPLKISLKGGGKARAWQTDQKRNCEEVESTAAMPPLSVRTLVFE